MYYGETISWIDQADSLEQYDGGISLVFVACSVVDHLLDSLSGIGCTRAWGHGLGGTGHARPLVGTGHKALPHE